jgi:hypothetical protein
MGDMYRNPVDGKVRSREAWERIFEFSGIAWEDVVLEAVPDDPEATVMMMNTPTGSVDTLQNWRADWQACTVDTGEPWEEWSVGLVRVIPDGLGGWIQFHELEEADHAE